ncbi:MAG: FAD-dependent oxidoreductase [Devosia sp.]|nr:FAD-dependent oxidoreductase [Devosia sp.]
MSAGMVIVGAGECGVRAALALREQGFAGPVDLIGAERHLPYERPPLSKEIMAGDAEPSPRTIASADKLAAAGISFHPQRTVSGIDRAHKQIVLTGGDGLAYDKLLLATGAVPRRLPMAPEPTARIAYFRTFDDALRIRAQLLPGRTLAIVGGGFIGLELAASARHRGAGIVVVEALPRLLSRGVPEPIARLIEARHRAAGVDFVFGTGLAAIDESAAGVRLRLADGREITADFVVIGIGAVPETGLAAAAGLSLDNGIAVDRFLATSDPDIFAAGDCCSFPHDLYDGRRLRLESWRSAQEQGTLAARNMLGAAEAVSAVPWFWSDQYELTLQIAGLPDEGASIVERESEGSLVLFHLKPDGRLVGAAGIGPGNAVARDIRVAEMLIARRAHPDLGALAKPDFKLRSLLAA